MRPPPPVTEHVPFIVNDWGKKKKKHIHLGGGGGGGANMRPLSGGGGGGGGCTNAKNIQTFFRGTKKFQAAYRVVGFPDKQFVTSVSIQISTQNRSAKSRIEIGADQRVQKLKGVLDKLLIWNEVKQFDLALEAFSSGSSSCQVCLVFSVNFDCD